MRRSSTASRYAERVLAGLDDGGKREQIVLWLERKSDGVWAIGRAVNPQHRPTDEPRPGDYLFESYELDEALTHANEVLEDDVRVLEEEGVETKVAPFTRGEVLPRLERWFFRS